MDARHKRAARRIASALFMAAGLDGCAYAPPYAVYDSYAYYPAYYYPAYSYYYPAYSYPTYVGPPIALNFGFGYYHHSHGYHGYHGGYGHYGGYRHHGGWGHGRH